MIRESRDVVKLESIGKFLDLLAAQAVYDARFAGSVLDIADYLFVGIGGFVTDLII